MILDIDQSFTHQFYGHLRFCSWKKTKNKQFIEKWAINEWRKKKRTVEFISCVRTISNTLKLFLLLMFLWSHHSHKSIMTNIMHLMSNGNDYSELWVNKSHAWYFSKTICEQEFINTVNKKTKQKPKQKKNPKKRLWNNDRRHFFFFLLLENQCTMGNFIDVGTYFDAMGKCVISVWMLLFRIFITRSLSIGNIQQSIETKCSFQLYVIHHTLTHEREENTHTHTKNYKRKATVLKNPLGFKRAERWKQKIHTATLP